MRLIYGGQTFEYTPPFKPYRKPRALNWRYQVPGETYGDTRICAPYRKPRAINWRYLVV